jgi:hypothetical protein
MSKQIELYVTWIDKRNGNYYIPGIYDAKALPKRALEIPSNIGRVIDSENKEEIPEKPETIKTDNKTLRVVAQETTRPKPKSTSEEDYKKQDLTPKTKKSPKTTKKTSSTTSSNKTSDTE